MASGFFMLPFITIFSLKLPMYGICLTAGIFSSFALAAVLCRLRGLCIYDLFVIVALIMASAMVGAKVLFLLVTYPLHSFFRVLYESAFVTRTIGAGFVFYGGLIAAVGGFFAGCRIVKARSEDFAPIICALIPLAHAFGRLGCFCAGCCYGIDWEGAFSVVYTNPIGAVVCGVGVFPVQLLEAALLLLLALVLVVLTAKGGNSAVWGYFFSYPVIRIVTEFFRGDIARGFLGALSTSQVVSIGVFLATLVAFVTVRILSYNKVNKALKSL